jgi:hypothetical protein
MIDSDFVWFFIAPSPGVRIRALGRRLNGGSIPNPN